jgi:hypothetical protein
MAVVVEEKAIVIVAASNIVLAAHPIADHRFTSVARILTEEK